MSFTLVTRSGYPVEGWGRTKDKVGSAPQVSRQQRTLSLAMPARRHAYPRPPFVRVVTARTPHLTRRVAHTGGS